MMQRFLSILFNIIIHILNTCLCNIEKGKNMENLFVDIDKLLKCLNI